MDRLVASRRSAPRLLPHPVGPYTAVDHIGRGGVADILLAHAGDTVVALKVLHPWLQDDPGSRRTLHTEAALGRLLRYRNVVRVGDLTHDHGTPVLPMEYVDGLDLQRILKGASQRRVPFPLPFALYAISQVLGALAHVHQACDGWGRPLAVVHRDISPSNLLVAFDGSVKLCDFGIAAAAGLPADRIAGKPGYLSPELARGDRVDGRADVYSAGIVLWEVVAGRRMRRTAVADDALDCAAQGLVPALPERDLPFEGWLHGLVHAALALEPTQRPAAFELREEIDLYRRRSRLWWDSAQAGRWLRRQFPRALHRARPAPFAPRPLAAATG